MVITNDEFCILFKDILSLDFKDNFQVPLQIELLEIWMPFELLV